MRYFGVGDVHSTAILSHGETTMSEPDKKDKPKKKKSTTKEKDDTLSPPDGDRKQSLTPERKGSEKEAKSRKGSSVEGLENESKSRKESTAEGETKSRKQSIANTPDNESKSRKSSIVEEEDETGSRKPSEVTKPEIEEGKEEETCGQTEGDATTAAAAAGEQVEENQPIKYFEAPPESTKTDIHLLENLDTRRLAELMEAFAMFDFDQDGVINEHDLKRTFASLDRPDMPEDEIQQMLSEGLNPLDFDAFVVLMGYKTLELDAEEVLTDALAQWDYGTEGLISEDRMRHDLMSFGDRFSDEEANAALEDAPVVMTKNKEKMIDYMRFSNDLCGLRKRMKDYKPTTTK